MFEMLVLALLLLCEFIAEDFGVIIALVLIFLAIGTIIEHIEIACIVIGIISLIACTIMMFKAFDWCFNKGGIGALLSIIIHIVLIIGMGLSGTFFISMLILLIGTVIGWYQIYYDSEGLGMFYIILSLIIPTIILILTFG